MYFRLLSNQLLIANFDENWIYLCSIEKYSNLERRKEYAKMNLLTNNIKVIF